MKFEWNTQKNQINQAKHKISFEIAARVFADSERIELYDKAHSNYEDRWITIGMVHSAILVVVYTERDNNIVRIISARPAHEQEKRAYYGI